MLEVVFSDSAKAAMKLAKRYSKKGMLGGDMGYVGRKPSKAELEKLFEGEAVPGDPADVVCIGCNFDVGDISGELDDDARKEVFTEVFGSVEFRPEELERFFRLQREDFEKLLTAAKSGKTIRVWKSDIPSSACAFAFVCHALHGTPCDLRAVSLSPLEETATDTVQQFSDWAEVMPGRFYRFLPLEQPVSTAERRVQKILWDGLKAENAPLRALVNGKLLSVGEDFYDRFLFKCIPDGEFVMARLIGNVLITYPLGVSDGWYALRIKKLLSQKRLELVKDMNADHPYGKVLRKTALF